MCRLADHLRVAPNTLYSYSSSKAALMDAVLDSLLAEIDIPELDEMDWRDGLVALMEASRRTLLSHADLLPLAGRRQASTDPPAPAPMARPPGRFGTAPALRPSRRPPDLEGCHGGAGELARTFPIRIARVKVIRWEQKVGG